MTQASFEVRFTEDSARDLNEIVDYISANGSVDDALRVADAIEHRIDSLNQFPERGSILQELQGATHCEYRQLLVWPYRIIYFVDALTVEIFMIVDGRRNFQSHISSRMTSST
ncbi:MAG: type II toxin-antitoxin system RelE/ParE family toxin [Sphingomicrobium sp.]